MERGMSTCDDNTIYSASGNVYVQCNSKSFKTFLWWYTLEIVNAKTWGWILLLSRLLDDTLQSLALVYKTRLCVSCFKLCWKVGLRSYNKYRFRLLCTIGVEWPIYLPLNRVKVVQVMPCLLLCAYPLPESLSYIFLGLNCQWNLRNNFLTLW